MKASYCFEGKIINPVFLPKNYLAFTLYETNYPILAVYDLKNKFFAYYNNMFQSVNFITCDLYDKTIYFMAENHQEIKQIFSLKEKENYHKFNVFYKKHLYELAFDFARNACYSIEEIAEIYKKYGDYLYSNNEFQKALEQYSQTILHIHPSQIIEKFIDNSKIEYLISYLEKLHNSQDFKNKFEADMVNYSKLLINIYSKMKKINKLNFFVDKIDFSLLEKSDVDNLINICLDQNHVKTALCIADKAKFTNRILEIFIDNKSECLFYF